MNRLHEKGVHVARGGNWPGKGLDLIGSSSFSQLGGGIGPSPGISKCMQQTANAINKETDRHDHAKAVSLCRASQDVVEPPGHRRADDHEAGGDEQHERLPPPCCW